MELQYYGKITFITFITFITIITPWENPDIANLKIWQLQSIT